VDRAVESLKPSISSGTPSMNRSPGQDAIGRAHWKSHRVLSTCLAAALDTAPPEMKPGVRHCGPTADQESGQWPVNRFGGAEGEGAVASELTGK
jgi:hypothetical protein